MWTLERFFYRALKHLEILTFEQFEQMVSWYVLQCLAADYNGEGLPGDLLGVKDVPGNDAACAADDGRQNGTTCTNDTYTGYWVHTDDDSNQSFTSCAYTVRTLFLTQKCSRWWSSKYYNLHIRTRSCDGSRQHDSTLTGGKLQSTVYLGAL